MKTNHGKSPNLKVLVDAAWCYAKALLWDNQEFTDAEQELTLDLIEKDLAIDEDPSKSFIEFCERVALAHQYINRDNSRFAPHPLKWFSPHYPHGYVGTESWYLNLLDKRILIPIHRFEVRVMAEAYLRFIDDPSIDTYLEGKKAILHYDHSGILHAYNSTILNSAYMFLSWDE